MKRLFWIGVGATVAVVALRKTRELVDAHTPPGVAQAAGIVTGLGGALRTARSEFSAGLTEREAELRRGLLGDVDLDAARTQADAWRSGRAQRSGGGRRRRPGSVDDASSPSGRHSDGPAQPRAQDPSDGDLGYSFF